MSMSTPWDPTTIAVPLEDIWIRPTWAWPTNVTPKLQKSVRKEISLVKKKKKKKDAEPWIFLLCSVWMIYHGFLKVAFSLFLFFCLDSQKGKHGNLIPKNLTASGDVLTYVDNQLQFSGEDTTIVGRSIVVHSNGARIACANLVTSTCHENGLESVDSKREKTTSKPTQAEEDEGEDKVEEGGVHPRVKLGVGLALRGLRSKRRLR